MKCTFTFPILLSAFLFGSFQSSARHRLLSEIPVLYNIDSLEARATKQDKKSEEHFYTLITIEWSRLQIRAGDYGKHCTEISSLADHLREPIGKPFVDYVTASSTLGAGYAVNHFTVNAAENALRDFSTNGDLYGMFFCNILIARLYTSRLYQQETDDSSFRAKMTEGLQKISSHNAAADSIWHLNRDNGLWIYLTLHKAKTEMTAYPKGGDAEKAKRLCNQVLQHLSLSGKQTHYQSLAYFFYADAFFVQDSLEKGVAYEKLGLQALLPAQVALRSGSMIGIANHTNTLGQIDTSMRYCRMAMDLLGKKSDDGNFEYLNLYENAVSNFQEKKMLDSALFYSEKLKFATNAYFQKLYENEQKNFAFDFQFALDKQKVEEQNSINKKIITVTLLFLLVVLSLLIFLFRSRKKLKQAYVQIEELQHAREKFYSIVAHDLKSPLVSYQNLAATLNSLIKKNDFDRIEKISQRIDQNGAQLYSMLENLFKWSLSEQKNLSYQAAIIAPDAVLKDILPIYQQLADEKNLQFYLQTDFPSQISVDPNYFLTVIRNLLDNAIKNADQSVTFRSFVQDRNVIIEICNSGIVDNEKMMTITELFRSDKAWQPGEKGIGLGLILTRDFCRKMQASISCTSQDHMVVFRISLPLL